MMASALMEVDQLRGLKAYVANVEKELAEHNELKAAIELAVSTFFPCSTLSLANDVSFAVLAPPRQLQQSHGQLAAQVRLPPARNRQVPDV